MINCNNMKKIYYFLFLLIGTLSMTSCLKDDNTYEDYEAWRVANEAFYNQMKDSVWTNPETGKEESYYKEIASLAYPEYKILYHQIDSVENDGRKPYFTSTVKVDYAGHLYNTTTNFDAQNGMEFKVSGVIQGWTLALMNMTAGEKWEVVIPWQLAYGAAGAGSIPPYSTLVFDIKLLEITKWEKVKGNYSVINE